MRFTATSIEADNDPLNNVGSAFMRITGPGWEGGYGAMARDEGDAQGVVGGEGIFIAINRMELAHDGTIPLGITAWISAGSDDSTVVRAILFDDQLAFLDTSARHTVTEQDLIDAAQGGLLHLLFSAPEERPAGDYFVGLQRL